MRAHVRTFTIPGRIIVAVLICSWLLGACSSKNERFTERVFVANLVKDEQKLEQYLAYHKQVWPEVEAGFRKAGYKRITLYRFKYLLVMTITVPEQADLQQMSRTAEDYDKRCAEWNRLMSQFQTGVEGTVPGQTWVEADRYYLFKND